jgi:phosphotriesterase-related protein
MKSVQTVCGEIESDKLGMTLPHENCLIDSSCWWKGPPKELSKRDLFKQKVTLKNRGEVVYNCFYFLDNLILDDIKVSIEEVKDFVGYGGQSIVDLTNTNGRDPQALHYISKITGANIIMGSGRYIENSLSEEQKKMRPEEIAKEIVEEFDNGADGTGIKPGVIGESAISNVNNRVEINGLIGAAKAQKKIGCGLNVHPPIWETQGNKILDILEKQKVDLNKVALCHCDPTLDNWKYHDSLAKRGAYIHYDQFGMELMTNEGIFLPSDGERITAVKKQIELGNLNRILISGDLAFKIVFKKWGGWGYTHILNHIIPRMKQAGITTDQIHTITVENPKRLLEF